MTKKNSHKRYDNNLIEALEKLPNPIYDKKHNIYIYVDNGRARSNETRYEHLAKSSHQLKRRDIESIPEGISNYFAFKISKRHKETYYYYILRKGNQKGFIQVAVKLLKGSRDRAYIKTIFVTYRIQN